MFLLDLKNVNLFNKDFQDYRLWISLSHQKMNLKEKGRGDYEAAVDYIRYGIRQTSTNFALLYNFGAVNEKLGNYKIARKYFNFAQRVKPTSIDAYIGDAVVCFKMGYYQDSFKILQKTIDLLPKEQEQLSISGGPRVRLEFQFKETRELLLY